MDPTNATFGQKSGSAINYGPDSATKLAMYERMLVLRRAEERLAQNFKEGILPGNVHLYVGQEAVAVGVCNHLSDRDWITSTHRGHGHFLAKGGEPEGLFAEIYGHEGGICKGFGGTMHVADFSKGIVGANGIVGAGMPIATGAALTAQLDGDGRVAVAFFGDGAANRGVLLETLNIAALWQLPLVFMCEPNGYCEFSPQDTVTAGAIYARAAAFEIPSVQIDGNDVEKVWRTAGAAIDRARKGEGPSFIEATTYRLRGHAEAEVFWLSEPYRTEEEVASWRAKDPLPRFAEKLQQDGVADAATLAKLDAEVTQRIERASQAAASRGTPKPDLLQAFIAQGGAGMGGREHA
jgi:TPP-dependent pyruvate/acetoin dehydrogenase alpha subunit